MYIIKPRGFIVLAASLAIPLLLLVPNVYVRVVLQILCVGVVAMVVTVGQVKK